MCCVGYFGKRMAGSPINARRLNGLSLAEAFSKYVLGDPDVTALAALVLKQDEAYMAIFREGRYPGPYVEYAWPLDITADELAYQFVRPVVYFLGPDPTISKEIRDVSAALVARIGMIRELLTSGKIIARGTFARTGIVSEVARLQWARRESYIDVQNSDLLEDDHGKHVVKWSGLTLHLPAATPLKAQVIDVVRSVGGINTAHRASVEAAVAALWPKGIPQGVTVKDRDRQINDWQRLNRQVVTSGKTIKRHLDGA